MDVMGWSSSAMVKRYQHITAPVRMDIAKRVGGLLWAEPTGKPEGERVDPDDGIAGVLASV
jgi:integrase